MIIVKDLAALRYLVQRQLETAKNQLATYQKIGDYRDLDIANAQGQIYGFSQSLMFIDKLIEATENKKADESC